MSTNILVFVCLMYLQSYVKAQNRPVLNPLAIGGMVQGLLDIQIRPEGGFYQNRYKNIFTDHVDLPVVTNGFDRRNSLLNSKRSSDILVEDGKLLAEATLGTRPNPCFDEERITRNRLLLLVCSLQLVKDQHLDLVH